MNFKKPVKLFFFSLHYFMLGVEADVHSLLVSALHEGDLSASCPGRFTSEETEGYSASLKNFLGAGDEKHYLLLPRVEPRFFACPACSLVNVPTTLSRILQ